MKKVFTCLALYFCLFFPEILVVAPAALHARQDVPLRTYTLQLVTIPDKATADAELEKIRKRGHDVYIVEYTTESGKVIYKLRSGNFTSRADAVAAADQYTKKEGGSVLIVTRLASEERALPSGPEPTGAQETDTAKKKDEADKTVDPADTTGKTVVSAAQTEAKSSPPNSLAEKINALKRGEMPPEKNIKPGKRHNADFWFTIQSSTEFDKSLADRSLNKLRDKGYDAFCVEVVQNGQHYYKIRFGRFASAREARRAARDYNERERRNCMIIKVVAGVDAAPSPARDTASKKRAQAPNTDLPTQAQKKTSPAATDPAQQDKESQDPDELAAKQGIEQPEQIQPEAENEQAQQDPVPEAELPAEPDTPAEKPVTASPENSDQQKTQPPDGKAPIAKRHERIISIYAYRQKSGALNLTNRYEDIPDELRKNIDYISLFPARVTDIAKNGQRVTLECQKEHKEIILAGLTITEPGDAARAYLKALEDKPLRLKYNPWINTKDGAIAGRLYRKNGAYINLDMVRKGLGKYDRKTLAPDQQEAFRKAQDAARKEGAGIWQ